MDSWAMGEKHSAFISTEHQLWICGDNSTLKAYELDISMDIVAISYGGICWFVDDTGTVWKFKLLNDVKPKLFNLPEIKSISASWCERGAVIFLDKEGHVWKWRSTINNSSKYPKMIERLPSIKSISAGFRHYLFLDTAGNAWTTGHSQYGALGLGDICESKYPVKIPNLPPILEIATSRHSLFLDIHGVVWSCGLYNVGQLGYAIEDLNDVQKPPRRIEDLPPIKSISAGKYHSLFLDVEGSAWSCGDNSYGQRGHGKLKMPIPIPSRVKNVSEIVAMKAGFYSSLFVDVFASVWGCGRNDEIQMGVKTEKTRIKTPQKLTIPPPCGYYFH